MALRELLNQEIQKNLTSEEKRFYGMDDELSQKTSEVQTDFGLQALQIIQSTIKNAKTASIEQLETSLTRLKNLRRFVPKANLGEQENNIINEALTKAETALKAQLSSKKSIFGRAKKLISENSVDLGALIVGMSANDPLVALGVKLIGDKLRSRKERKLQAKEDTRLSTVGDAEALQAASTQPEVPGDMPSLPKGLPESGQPFGGLGGDQQVLITLQNIFLFTEEISTDLKTLVRIQSDQLELEQVRLKIERENDLESSRMFGGGEKQGKLLGATGAKDLFKFGRGVIDTVRDGLITLMATIPGFSAISRTLGRFGLVASLGGGLLWAAIDGIVGYFKAEEWGTTKIAGIIGGFFGGTFNNKILNVIGNMGKWALIGAGLGTVFPVVGTLIGGLIGAALGGILGWIGGENIAKFTDKSVKFLKDSIVSIYQFIMDGVLSIVAWIKDTVVSILEYIPSTEEIRQKLQSVYETTKQAGSGVKLAAQDATNAALGLVGISPKVGEGAELYQQEQQRKIDKNKNIERFNRRIQEARAAGDNERADRLKAQAQRYLRTDMERPAGQGKPKPQPESKTQQGQLEQTTKDANLTSINGVLDAIAMAESGKNGYNAMNQGGNSETGVIGSGHSKDIIGENLTDLTVGQVLDRGKIPLSKALRDPDSGRIFAAGRYQIIPSTLEGLVRKGIVSREDKFDPATQDKLAIGLLNEQRVPQLINEQRFAEAQNRIANIWAGIGKTSGGTALGGPNKANVAATSRLQTALASGPVTTDIGSTISRQNGAVKIQETIASKPTVIQIADNSIKNTGASNRSAPAPVSTGNTSQKGSATNAQG